MGFFSAGILVANSYLFTKQCLYCTFVLRDFSMDKEFQIGRYFPSNTDNLIPLSSGFHCFIEKLAVSLIANPLKTVLFLCLHLRIPLCVSFSAVLPWQDMTVPPPGGGVTGSDTISSNLALS